MTRRRKLAATAATAVIAVASPAAASKQSKPRPHPGAGKARVGTLASTPAGEAQRALDVMRRTELREHRRLLASALAAELPSAEATSVERGLAAAATDPAALGAALAGATGASEQQVEDAFEAMASRARAERLRG